MSSLQHYQRDKLVETQCPAMLDLLAHDPHLEPGPAPTNVSTVHLGPDCCPQAYPAAATMYPSHQWFACDRCVPQDLWADVMRAAPVALIDWQLSVSWPVPALGDATRASVGGAIGQLWPLVESLTLSGAALPVDEMRDPATAAWATQQLERLRADVNDRRLRLAQIEYEARPNGAPKHWVLIPDVTRLSHITARPAVIEPWVYVARPALVVTAPSNLVGAYETSTRGAIIDLGPVDANTDSALWPAFFTVYGHGKGCSAPEALDTARALVIEPRSA